MKSSPNGKQMATEKCKRTLRRGEIEEDANNTYNIDHPAKNSTNKDFHRSTGGVTRKSLLEDIAARTVQMPHVHLTFTLTSHRREEGKRRDTIWSGDY